MRIEAFPSWQNRKKGRWWNLPVLDFSEDSKVGRAGKMALKLTALGLEKDKGIPVNQEMCNDFRDWDKIRRFADNFASLLK